MFASRDEVRRVYLEVWRKLRTGEILQPLEAIIAEVIEAHPEYHAALDNGDETTQRDYTPEQGIGNPFLHMGMHIALREQAAADRPPGVREVHRRLVAERGQHAAEHAMMECLGETLWRAERERRPPDEAAFLECLEKL